MRDVINEFLHVNVTKGQGSREALKPHNSWDNDTILF